MTALTYFF